MQLRTRETVSSELRYWKRLRTCCAKAWRLFRRGSATDALPTDALPTHPQTLAVVDDNQELLSAISDVLTDCGYNVLPYLSAERALRYLQYAAELPGLIVLDVAMSGMSGVEMLRHLRNDPALRDIPVLIFTAMAPDKWPRGVSIAQKPVAVDRLLEKIEKLYREPKC